MNEKSKPLVLDVREPWEFEKCRIEGSRLIPLSQLPARLGELPVVGFVGEARAKKGLAPLLLAFRALAAQNRS